MPFTKELYHQKHLNLMNETNPHLFEAVIFAQSPAVSITVDRDLHCGSSAHDTVCHAGASLKHMKEQIERKRTFW